jgi:signal peptide peptidase SppA
LPISRSIYHKNDFKTIGIAMNAILRSIYKITGLKPKTRIHALRLEGVIMSGKKYLSLEKIDNALKKTFEGKPDYVALIINSPGGSPVQSALIGNRIRQLAQEKNVKVLAFVEDVAASGGYWLACAADEIYGLEASILGSIGVISGGFGFSELIKKIGVERRIYTAGENKSFLDPFSEARDEDIETLKKLQLEIHEVFKSWVKSRRGDKFIMTHAQSAKLFTGAFWVGVTAKELGLIDKITDMHTEFTARFGKNYEIKEFKTESGFNLKKMLGLGRLGQEALEDFETRAHYARFGM